MSAISVVPTHSSFVLHSFILSFIFSLVFLLRSPVKPVPVTGTIMHLKVKLKLISILLVHFSTTEMMKMQAVDLVTTTLILNINIETLDKNNEWMFDLQN